MLTSTESVAEFTKRPLLSITAADLGDKPEQLERNLLSFFRNAHDWDAIVLLDEADIYLEARSAENLRRNSIVSGEWHSYYAVYTTKLINIYSQYSFEHWTTFKAFFFLPPTVLDTSTKLSCLESMSLLDMIGSPIALEPKFGVTCSTSSKRTPSGAV